MEEVFCPRFKSWSFVCHNTMLSVLLTVLMFSQGLSMDNRGTNFITAFPENIAFYFNKNYNQLEITTLHPNTRVQVFCMANSSFNTDTNIGSAGTTLALNFSKSIEEYNFLLSNKTIQIISDNNITVLSVTGWYGRIQSRVVQPQKSLGTVYQIPPVNYTKMGNLSVFPESRYKTFRLMIINSDSKNNVVTITQLNNPSQSQQATINLGPYQLYQLQINGTITQVKSTFQVAVILTHPCLTSVICSCNLVMIQLQPAALTAGNISYVMPSILTTPLQQLISTANQGLTFSYENYRILKFVQVQNSMNILPLFTFYINGPLVVSTSMQVSLISVNPGLILDLIATSMYSACYLVYFNFLSSHALVIANTSTASGVMLNNQPLPATWNSVTGTDFTWALVTIQGTYTIWHPYSVIGVYIIEYLEFNNIYASPALSINTIPDPNGCLLTPEMFQLGKNEMNWSMSLQYCSQTSGNLALLNTQEIQSLMASNVTVQNPTQGWIGLRRDLFTTQWYWSVENGDPVNLNFTNWDQDQPQNPDKGLCASVSLDPSTNFVWQSSPCCTEMTPVCSYSPQYLNPI